MLEIKSITPELQEHSLFKSKGIGGDVMLEGQLNFLFNGQCYPKHHRKTLSKIMNTP